MNLGYCCINLSLPDVTTNRRVIKATFQKEGLPTVSRLALQNAKDLYKILQFNAQNDIHLFRISSGIFPWGTEYRLEDLPDYAEISEALAKCGNLATQTNQRLSAHPDHFVKLGSEKEEVVQNSIKDLELHGQVFDLLNLSRSHFNPLNIHVGQNRTNEVIERFCKNVDRLSDSVRSRLVVENDDKPNCFSVKQLFSSIYENIGTPITFDYFHHTLHPDDLSSQEAAQMAASTWKSTPLFHYSSSKVKNEPGEATNIRAHADYIYEKIQPFVDCDIDLEAKAKDLALLRYRAMVH